MSINSGKFLKLPWLTIHYFHNLAYTEAGQMKEFLPNRSRFD